MAHFRGTVQGNRGEASRLGSKESGLCSKNNGWNLGCTSIMRYSEDLDTDTVSVYITSGSSYSTEEIFLGKFYKDDNGKIKKVT